jgi:hypothetical protein
MTFIKKITTLLFISLFFFVSAKAQKAGKQVQINAISSVYVLPTATEEEAKKLGDYLLSVNFFDTDKPRGVQLTKVGKKYIVRFIVEADKQYLKENPSLRKTFTEKATELSQNVFNGARVVVELINGGSRKL